MLTLPDAVMDGLHPQFAYYIDQYLKPYADYLGISARAISGLRNNYEQATLYRKGRTPVQVTKAVKMQGRGGSVTDARPYESAHNWGLAIDFDGPGVPKLHELARSLGFGTISWDLPHVEYPDWIRALGLTPAKLDYMASQFFRDPGGNISL